MEKFKILLSLSLFALAAAAGCSPAGSRWADLEGTRWTLVEIDGAPALPSPQATLGFEDGQASGSASCNAYSGEVNFKSSGEIEFGLLMSTAMACISPPGIMEQESAFLSALSEAERYALEQGLLMLMDGDGMVRLVLEPQTAP